MTKDGTFEDAAIDAELVYDSANGVAMAAMGVGAGVANGDSVPDFVVTNFNDQYHSLFLGIPAFTYNDRRVKCRTIIN